MLGSKSIVGNISLEHDWSETNTVLKRILLLLLVVCTLGYGSAWAYDGQIVETDTQLLTSDAIFSPPDNEQTDSLDSTSSSPEQSIADTVCTYCSHIFSHLQAIFPQSENTLSMNQSSEIREYSESSFSLLTSPDLRPPRA